MQEWQLPRLSEVSAGKPLADGAEPDVKQREQDRKTLLPLYFLILWVGYANYKGEVPPASRELFSLSDTTSCVASPEKPIARPVFVVLRHFPQSIHNVSDTRQRHSATFRTNNPSHDGKTATFPRLIHSSPSCKLIPRQPGAYPDAKPPAKRSFRHDLLRFLRGYDRSPNSYPQYSDM